MPILEECYKYGDLVISKGNKMSFIHPTVGKFD